MKRRSSRPGQDNISKAPDTLVKEIIYMIRRLMQAGAIHTKKLQKTHQVSFAQLYCLLTLHENGPMPISKIASKILVKSSTLTGIVDRLENKGFVKRVRNSNDRRIIKIELTPKGESLVKEAPPLIQQQIVDGLQGLPKKEAEQVLFGLRLLTKMLDVEDIPADKVPEAYISDIDS